MNLLVTLGEKKNRVFLPSDYDLRIAAGLERMFIKNHDDDLIEECIKKYILSSNEITFSISDFATRLTGIYKDLKDGKKSREQMNKLLAETKERMEQS